MRFTLNYDQYAALARQTAAEGCVLLKNEKEALPIRKGETVSVFGRIAFTYYKSGTGSGGMVNAPYVTNILDSLKECRIFLSTKSWKRFIRTGSGKSLDMGEGWAQEPWSQKEMPVSEALAQKAAASSDLAVVVLGRTAGEDMDNSAEPEAIC
ncbi:MAG: glycoside hydrolase family 3 C-terminal domain-containing protein [Gallintestinimicrobium sp.]